MPSQIITKSLLNTGLIGNADELSTKLQAMTPCVIWSGGTLSSKMSLIFDKVNDMSKDAAKKCPMIFSLTVGRSWGIVQGGVVWLQRKEFEVQIIDE